MVNFSAFNFSALLIACRFISFLYNLCEDRDKMLIN
jgi:hypothetical protein